MKMEVPKLADSQSNDLLKYYNLAEDVEAGSEKEIVSVNGYAAVETVESPSPSQESDADVMSNNNGYGSVDASENNNIEESGVEDGPVKNVREIRAMFNKNYDYESYAKPRSFNKSPTSPSPKSENHFTYSESDTNNQTVTPVVQQQVRGLFQGVFEVEKKPKPPVPPPRSIPPKPKEINNNEPAEPWLTVAQKVACFNTAKPPVVSRVEVDPNKSPVIESPTFPQSPPQEEQHEVEEEENNNVIIENLQNEVQHKSPPSKLPDLTITQMVDEENDIKEVLAKVQKETLNLETFDESLDQFYNVLEELSI